MFKKDEIKIISIFGVTGSVGVSTQELIQMNTKKFKVDTIVANNDMKGLIKAAKYLKPNLVIVNNDKMFMPLKNSLEGYNLSLIHI